MLNEDGLILAVPYVGNTGGTPIVIEGADIGHDKDNGLVFMQFRHFANDYVISFNERAIDEMKNFFVMERMKEAALNKERNPNGKAAFAVKVLREYADESKDLMRSTSSLNDFEQYLIIKLFSLISSIQTN